MADVKTARERPISPHLSIYRLTVSMAMSIAHRITGSIAYVAIVFLVGWLLAAASGPGPYAAAQDFFGSIIGQIVLLGSTWALIHHTLGGIRHLVWDTIHGLDYPQREWLSLGTLVGGVVLTLVVWVVGYAIWL